MDFDLLCTAVSERADLFVQTMDSCLQMLDKQPQRILVHEDVRPGSSPGAIFAWLEANKQKTGIDFVHKVTAPSRGMGPAMLWCLEQAKTEFVFYTQEDWLFVRPVPVARALEVLARHGLHHVRFNKRKTMSAKHADTAHPWKKVEVSFPMPDGVTETWCISDHFYTQASLYRVALVLEGVRAVAHKSPQANAFVRDFNHHMNLKHIGDPAKAGDQQLRHQKLATYIFGPVATPAFISHLGSVRTTGPIQHVGEIRAMKKRNK